MRRMILPITIISLTLLLSIGLVRVFSADDLPKPQAVLAKDYTHIFRRPWFAIIDNKLMLFWQRPSLGPKGMQPIKVISPNGEEHMETSELPGMQSSLLEYAVIAANNLDRKLPLKSSLGTIEIPEPGRNSPSYSVVSSPDAASYILGYESGLSSTLLNEFHSVTLLPLTSKDNILVAGEQWTLPKRVRFLWPHEGVERYMKTLGLTEEQVLSLRGSAPKEEYSKDYANPVLAQDKKDHVLLCAGTIEQGDQPEQGNIWLTSSTDAGKTWASQTTLGWGLLPTITTCDGEVFVIATDRIRENLVPDYMWGFWPDEWIKGLAWPVMGRLMLWHWQWGKAFPKNPVVVVAEPKAVQSTLTVRNDGLLVLIYAKTEFVGSTTSLWITTSQDGLKWETPRRLTDGKFIDRDASAVFYQGCLWIAFARAEGKMPSSIYLIKYDKLSPMTGKASQETKTK